MSFPSLHKEPTNFPSSAIVFSNHCFKYVLYILTTTLFNIPTESVPLVFINNFSPCHKLGNFIITDEMKSILPWSCSIVGYPLFKDCLLGLYKNNSIEII